MAKIDFWLHVHGKGKNIFIDRDKAKWEHYDDSEFCGGGYTQCTSCDYYFADGAFYGVEEIFKFCPNCGASMQSNTSNALDALDKEADTT